jgi:hypothetical protein
MRKICATRMMMTPEPLSAHVECGGSPPLSVAEARLPRRLLAGLGDLGGVTSVGNPPSARLRTTIHGAQRGPKSAQLSDTPCKVISHVSHRKQTIGTLIKCHTFLCLLPVTACRVEFLLTHSKQRTAVPSTRHGNAPPSGRLFWLATRAFRIISEPISDKEPRV